MTQKDKETNQGSNGFKGAKRGPQLNNTKCMPKSCKVPIEYWQNSIVASLKPENFESENPNSNA